MKYNKGSIVEVFVNDELCYQSWRCAKIVSGNGHNYTVTYDVYPGFTDSSDVEHLTAKSIRPCPPLMEHSERWVRGDVVEVFHDLSWNMAIVLKDYGWDKFLVRLVGSSDELEVSRSELRVRQSYQNGEWVLIDMKNHEVFKEAGCTKKLFKCDQQDSGFEYQSKQRGTNASFSKSLKRRYEGSRSPCCYSRGEAYEGFSQKFRRSGKEGRRLLVLGTSLEKVDYWKENINETQGHSSAQINDPCSVVSSSGSCSSNSYNPNEVYSGSGPVEDHDSDAESVCQFRYYEETDRSPTNEALGYHGEHLIMLENLIAASGNSLCR